MKQNIQFPNINYPSVSECEDDLPPPYTETKLEADHIAPSTKVNEIENTSRNIVQVSFKIKINQKYLETQILR